MHIARELDPLREAPTSLELPGDLADVTGQCGGPTESVHGCALGVGQLERLAVTVGEDHAEPASGSRDGSAGELGDTRQLRVPGRYVRGQIGRLDHAVLRQRALCDRRLFESAVTVDDEVAVDAVASCR